MAEDKEAIRPRTTDIMLHGACLSTPLVLNKYDMTESTFAQAKTVDWDNGPVPLRANLPGPPLIGWNLCDSRTHTVIDLLALAERGSNTSAVFDFDARLVRAREETSHETACSKRTEYHQWHLELFMDLFCFSGFFVNVRFKLL